MLATLTLPPTVVVPEPPENVPPDMLKSPVTAVVKVPALRIPAVRVSVAPTFRLPVSVYVPVVLMTRLLKLLVAEASDGDDAPVSVTVPVPAFNWLPLTVNDPATVNDALSDTVPV